MSESQQQDTITRQRIESELDKNFIVEAAAGTGKTTCLVKRMVALVQTGTRRIDQLAAVTFTRKAAAELRERFQAALRNKATDGSIANPEELKRLATAADQVNQAFVGTIHSFCATLLRERPIEFGVDPAFRELDEKDDRLIREQAWQENIADLIASRDPLLGQLRDLDIDRAQLKKCFDQFIEYRDIENWPSTLPADIEFEGLQQATRDYIGEMRELVPLFPVERGTDKLMDRYERIVRSSSRAFSSQGRFFSLLEQFDTSPGETQKFWPAKELGIKRLGGRERDRWNDFRNDHVKPAITYWTRYRYQFVVAFLRRAVEVYERMKSNNGGLDFQDMLLTVANGLKHQPHLRTYFQGRFTNLLVDEFQDTDPLQAQMMLYLTASSPNQSDWTRCQPNPGALFLVGDPKQSIYRFRRGDIITYDKVKEIIWERDGEVLPLVKNFRSQTQLREWNNRVYRAKFGDQPTDYSPAAEDMIQGREDALLPNDEAQTLCGTYRLELPTTGRTDDIREFEADSIAKFIRYAIDSGMQVARTEPNALASGRIDEPTALAAGRTDELHALASGGISSDTNAPAPGPSETDQHFGRPRLAPSAQCRVQLRDFLIVPWGKKGMSAYTEALEKHGIPYQVSGGNPLSNNPQLAALVDCLRAIDDPTNPVHYLTVLRGFFGFSDRDLYLLKQAGGSLNYNLPIPDPKALASGASDEPTALAAGSPDEPTALAAGNEPTLPNPDPNALASGSSSFNPNALAADPNNNDPPEPNALASGPASETKSTDRNQPAPPVPEASANGSWNHMLHQRFSDVASRFCNYQAWIRSLPYATAVSRIANDLGVIASAAATEEGDMRAGGMLKVIEWLRSQSWDFDSATDLIQFLEEVLEVEDADACPALAPIGNVVRLMNLHKAKGLEAPIVFLADTSGRYRGEVRCHIDRSGESPMGYMGISAKVGEWKTIEVAAPDNWSAHQSEEQRFLDAEHDRSLYVATTRAACATIVSVGKDNSNWASLYPYLDDAPALDVPEPNALASGGFPSDPNALAAGPTPHPPAPYALPSGPDALSPSNPANTKSTNQPSTPVASAIGSDIADRINDKWAKSLTPSYSVTTAKKLGLKGKSRPNWEASGDYGHEWGSAVHELLEVCHKSPTTDLRPTALRLAREYNLGSSRVDELISTVQSVTASDIWKRAQASNRCYSELPFETTITDADGKPQLVRGVIDLIFEEEDGWVIVDYKTDDITEDQVDSATEYYRDQLVAYAEYLPQIFQEIDVVETTLLFTKLER